MTTTKLIELLKKYEFGGATGRAREVSIQIGNDIYDTDIKDISTGDGLVTELFLTLAAEQPELIRCKDCKYYTSGSDGMRYCFNHDDDILWQDDDFCSRAERRPDETN